MLCGEEERREGLDDRGDVEICESAEKKDVMSGRWEVCDVADGLILCSTGIESVLLLGWADLRLELLTLVKI